METVWFAIVSAMLAIYVVLDGFDFGAGIVHRFVARTDKERRTVLAAIGPVWDGNEVWLIAAGGVLFMALPADYSTAFSGFYLALMIVLWLLILRGVAIGFRSHQENPLWREFWDTVFSRGVGAAGGRVRHVARKYRSRRAAGSEGFVRACPCSRISCPARILEFSTGTRRSWGSSRSACLPATALCFSSGERPGRFKNEAAPLRGRSGGWSFRCGWSSRWRRPGFSRTSSPICSLVRGQSCLS